MRKLTILLAGAALVASTAGCCGRCRNWFHKGSPCGTVMAPPVTATPMAMTAPLAAPMMAAPMAAPMVAPQMCVEQQPMCIPCCPQPCVPCCPPCDPCTTGNLGYTGYTGDYTSPAGCCDGTTMETFAPGAVVPGTMAPSTVTPGTTMQVTPQPMGEN